LPQDSTADGRRLGVLQALIIGTSMIARFLSAPIVGLVIRLRPPPAWLSARISGAQEAL
jgi:hypothetical protein